MCQGLYIPAYCLPPSIPLTLLFPPASPESHILGHHSTRLHVASSSFCAVLRQEEEELSRVLLNLRRKDLGRNTPNLPFRPARLNQLAERRTCPAAVRGKSCFKLLNALRCNLKVGKRNSGSSPSTCLHREECGACSPPCHVLEG